MRIEDYDWDFLANDVANYLFAEAYINEVESYIDYESDYYNEDLYRKLSPGGSSDWMDVIPAVPLPEVVTNQAREIVNEFKKQLAQSPKRSEWLGTLEFLEEIDRAGFLLVMDALGHGVGLWEHGIKFDYYTEVDPDIRDFAEQVVIDEAEKAGIEFDEDEE